MDSWVPLGVQCSQKAREREPSIDRRSLGHVDTVVIPEPGLHPREAVGNTGSGALQVGDTGSGALQSHARLEGRGEARKN